MTEFDDAAAARRAARLSALLRETDEPARAPAFPAERIARRAAERSRARWRAAAAIALLLAGAAGVPPVRAWIVGTMRAAWVAVTGGERPAAPAAPVRAPANMGAVSFPAADPFVVRFATLQASGTIVVEGSNGRAGSVGITGEPNAAELLVTPDGVRVTNRRASTAGYVVRVPPSVARVMIVVANGWTRTFDAPAPGHSFTVDLGVRSAPPAALNR